MSEEKYILLLNESEFDHDQIKGMQERKHNWFNYNDLIEKPLFEKFREDFSYYPGENYISPIFNIFELDTYYDNQIDENEYGLILTSSELEKLKRILIN